MTTSGAYSVYFNGSLITTFNAHPIIGFNQNGVNNYSGTTNANYVYNTGITIKSGDTNQFGAKPNAYIDDICLYNKPLSTSDITSIYNGTILF